MSIRNSLPGLQQTREEKIVGLLSALVLLFGLLTVLLLGVWLSHLPGYQATVTRVSLRSEFESASGSTGAAEMARALEDQGTDEQPPEITQAAEHLRAVSALVHTELASLDGNGQPAKGNLGLGDEEGDARTRGHSGPDGDVVPDWQRWQIRYQAADVQEYARILDAFQVELGVMGGDESLISYARNLSQNIAKTRQGKATAEKRLRFVFASGDLKEADRLLAMRAGLAVEGRIVGQFYPDVVKQQMQGLERAALGTRPLSTVRHTIFGIRQGARGLEFFVERIEPARPAGDLAPL